MTLPEDYVVIKPIKVVRANFGVIRSKRKVVGSIQVKNPGLDLLMVVGETASSFSPNWQSSVAHKKF